MMLPMIIASQKSAAAAFEKQHLTGRAFTRHADVQALMSECEVRVDRILGG